MPDLDIRRNIEQVIQKEEDTLERLVHHIKSRLPWSEWPEADRKSFALALIPPPGRNNRSNSWETIKAEKLLNHFFPNPADRSLVASIMGHERREVENDRQIRRNAERIRADIIDIVEPWRIDIKTPSLDNNDIQEDNDSIVSRVKKRTFRS